MTETTDLNKSEQYTLSIRLSTDGFSFSVFNPLDEASFACHNHIVDESLSLTANLKQAFQQIKWLGDPFRRVNVLVSDRRFTLVPLEFFEEDAAETFFHHNHPEQDNETILWNIRQANQLAVVFGMDQSAFQYLQQQYPDAHFYSHVSPIVDYLAGKSRLGNSRKLYAHIRKDALDAFAFEQGRLLLCNSLQCNVTADRIYYLLGLWKTLGFDQERDELHLTGFLEEKEELTSELRQYIRQVFIMNPAANLDLQAIITCE